VALAGLVPRTAVRRGVTRPRVRAADPGHGDATRPAAPNATGLGLAG
jgi:hypothetical protein